MSFLFLETNSENQCFALSQRRARHRFEQNGKEFCLRIGFRYFDPLILENVVFIPS